MDRSESINLECSDWSYNGRHELTDSLRYNSTDPNNPTSEQTALDRSYDYDPIGNRKTATEGQSGTTNYTPNKLNQYEMARNPNQLPGQGFVYDADGNLTQRYLVGDINGDGYANDADWQLLRANLGKPCGDASLTITPEQFARADINGDCALDIGDVSAFTGNDYVDTAHTSVNYTWDAENRLIGVEPILPAAGLKKLAFKYDYRGRRIEKEVLTYSNGAWSTASKTRFVYFDWLLLAEYNVNSDGTLALQRKYTWGLDLAGQNGQVNSLTRAGGIGGLLAARDVSASKNYAYFYDGNGNVGQMMDVTGTGALAARYEYDAYGNTVAQAPDPNNGGTTFPYTNPWRFSTKQFDPETGYYYFGYRYYAPLIGRWLSRDPAFGSGTLGEYANVDPVNHVDPFGLYEVDFHYYVAYYLLRATCFTPTQANFIAGFSQYVDEDPLTQPINLDPARNAKFHFPGSAPGVPTYADEPSARSALKAALAGFEDGGTGVSARLGAALHTYADSYSHEGFSAYYDPPTNDRGNLIRPDMGHANAPEGGHAPDRPYNDVQRALTAAKYIYDILSSHCKKDECKRKWEDIEAHLASAFLQGQPNISSRVQIMQGLISDDFGDNAAYDASRFDDNFRKYFEKAVGVYIDPRVYEYLSLPWTPVIPR